MKRILAIIFVSQLFISSVCMAFEPPTDKRWLCLGTTNEYGCWVDLESMYYHIDDSYQHKGHKQVDVWVLFYNVTKDTSSRQRSTYDLTCQQYKLNSIVNYDKKGKVILSHNVSYPEFSSAVPGSWSESIITVCKAAWENDPRNQFK